MTIFKFYPSKIIFKHHTGLPNRDGGNLALLPLLGNREEPCGLPIPGTHPRLCSSCSPSAPLLTQNLQSSGRFDGVDADSNLPNAPAADARPGHGSSDAPRCGASPSPCPGEAQRGWVSKGTKEGAERPSQGCSGEQDPHIPLWNPLGAAPGWSQLSSEQPLGVLVLSVVV